MFDNFGSDIASFFKNLFEIKNENAPQLIGIVCGFSLMSGVSLLFFYCIAKKKHMRRNSIRKQIEEIRRDSSIKFIYVRGLPYRVSPRNSFQEDSHTSSSIFIV